VKHDPKRQEPVELFSSSREAAEAAVAAAKNAGASTWEDAAKRMIRRIPQWEDASKTPNADDAK
jgi:hypothetical protein